MRDLGGLKERLCCLDELGKRIGRMLVRIAGERQQCFHLADRIHPVAKLPAVATPPRSAAYATCSVNSSGISDRRAKTLWRESAQSEIRASRAMPRDAATVLAVALEPPRKRHSAGSSKGSRSISLITFAIRSRLQIGSVEATKTRRSRWRACRATEDRSVTASDAAHEAAAAAIHEVGERADKHQRERDDRRAQRRQRWRRLGPGDQPIGAESIAVGRH